MSDLTKAILLATRVHSNQTDKGGKPYILHPLRIMLKMENDIERIVSVLHDVIEDSSYTTKDLFDMGYGEEVIDSIVALTKKDGEQYQSYIERVKDNKIARKVKIEDLRDNLDLSRISDPTETDLKRNEKYQNALNFLLKEEPVLKPLEIEESSKNSTNELLKEIKPKDLLVDDKKVVKIETTQKEITSEVSNNKEDNSKKETKSTSESKTVAKTTTKKPAAKKPTNKTRGRRKSKKDSNEETKN